MREFECVQLPGCSLFYENMAALCRDSNTFHDLTNRYLNSSPFRENSFYFRDTLKKIKTSLSFVAALAAKRAFICCKDIYYIDYLDVYLLLFLYLLSYYYYYLVLFYRRGHDIESTDKFMTRESCKNNVKQANKLKKRKTINRKDGSYDFAKYCIMIRIRHLLFPSKRPFLRLPYQHR